MAERLARIAGVSLEELGRDIFSASAGDKSAQELLFADYKEFHIAGHNFAVSQITCVDSLAMLQRKDEFLTLMEKTAGERNFDLMALMLTDVLLEGTQLLFVGDEESIRQAFHLPNSRLQDLRAYRFVLPLSRPRQYLLPLYLLLYPR